MVDQLALRGLWILTAKGTTVADEEEGRRSRLQVLLSRRWGTVEARARAQSAGRQRPHGVFTSDKELALRLSDELLGSTFLGNQLKEAHSIESLIDGSFFAALPPSAFEDSTSFSSSFSSSSSSSSSSTPSASELDSWMCDMPADGMHFRRPFFGLQTSGFEHADVWPFVWQRLDHGIYLVALPLVSHDRSACPSTMPVIAAVLALLQELAPRMVLPPSYYASPTHIANLHLYLNAVMPYGSPVDTDATRVKLLTERGFQSTSSAMETVRPSWRPYLFGAPKSGQRIELNLNEMIDAYQYDKSSVPDIARAWGILQCRVLVNGLCEMQVSLSLSGEAALAILDLSSWGLHWCAQKSTQEHLEQELKVTCTPPSEPFPLLEYRIRPPFLAFPISGRYHLKILSRSQVQIAIQLQLHRGMSNQLEFCFVQIPMHNRGEITAIDGTPTVGGVTVDAKRKNLIRWNVGDKFPVRQNLEVTFRALITIDDTKPVRNLEHNDPFLTGSNAFCMLFFKIADSSISGVDISPKSITLSPAPTTKIPVSIRRSISSRSYLIWNSSGDVRRAISYDSSATLRT